MNHKEVRLMMKETAVVLAVLTVLLTGIVLAQSDNATIERGNVVLHANDLGNAGLVGEASQIGNAFLVESANKTDLALVVNNTGFASRVYYAGWVDHSLLADNVSWANEVVNAGVVVNAGNVQNGTVTQADTVLKALVSESDRVMEADTVYSADRVDHSDVTIIMIGGNGMGEYEHNVIMQNMKPDLQGMISEARHVINQTNCSNAYVCHHPDGIIYSEGV